MISALSFAAFGIILGFVGVFLAGFIQDWANEEEMFSWARKLGK